MTIFKKTNILLFIFFVSLNNNSNCGNLWQGIQEFIHPELIIVRERKRMATFIKYFDKKLKYFTNKNSNGELNINDALIMLGENAQEVAEGFEGRKIYCKEGSDICLQAKVVASQEAQEISKPIILTPTPELKAPSLDLIEAQPAA